jgi:hypothetical protein
MHLKKFQIFFTVQNVFFRRESICTLEAELNFENKEKKKREPDTRVPSSCQANPVPFAAPPLLQPPSTDGGAQSCEGVKTTPHH